MTSDEPDLSDGPDVIPELPARTGLGKFLLPLEQCSRDPGPHPVWDP